MQVPRTAWLPLIHLLSDHLFCFFLSLGHPCLLWVLTCWIVLSPSPMLLVSHLLFHVPAIVFYFLFGSIS